MSPALAHQAAPAATRLLVVDDHEPSRYATSRVLRAAGFEVIEAATGTDALALASENVDLVVLDVNLPDIDGFQVCRELRGSRATADLPICYLSATFTESEDVVRGMKTGADSYLVHPADPAVLVATVRALLFVRTAQTEKRAADVRFRTLFDLAPNGFAILDSALRFVDVNPALCELLGRDREQLLMQPLSSVCGAREQTELPELDATLRQGRSWKAILAVPHAAGESIDTEWVVTRDTNSESSIAVVSDVTARRRLEAAREHALLSEQAARAEAERSNQRKDEFLATLSHELRNPLNAILGWTELLKRNPQLSPEVARGINVIDRNSRLQSQLIADLLDFAGIRFGKMRLEKSTIDPQQALRAAVEVVSPQAEAKGVELQLRSLDQPGTLLADEARLQQVFWNLLTNAIKFTPRGGRVDITTRATEESFEVAVSDTGRGIDADFLPRLFDRFSQQDSGSAKSFSGLGIGLTIVRHLVTMHGGTISVASEGVGRGACFTVRLPRADVDVLARAPASERTLMGVRLLVVEDLDDTRALVVRLLSDAGAEVRDASTVQEALDIVAQYRPDVLVSDIGMPGTDGYELIRALRSRGYSAERLPAVALTAFARTEDRSDALEAGYQIHLTKPLNADVLIAAVINLSNSAASQRVRVSTETRSQQPQ
ncbi:MAG: response regulator [Gammaproteobacteria bacterium]|nr:response regulator [Gammaproteobacteria bacterium]